MSSNQATEPFVKALGKLLRDTDHEAVDEDGSINWSTLARQIPGMHYETLRKIKSGDRALDADVIEQIAKAARVDPTYFIEYRLLKARDLFDPKVVGFDQAAENLRDYLAVPAKPRAVKATGRPRTA
jgi:transcriptional regulator with XRE-family HTH domain